MKTCIAMACAMSAMLAGSAYGQASSQAASNVTLFGVLDMAAGRQQLAGRPSVYVLSPGNLITSRWGMTGSEDLGNGLRANFSLVSLIRPDTGSPGRFDGDAFFASRSTVGLSGGFGQINLGRMGSPLFLALLRFDPHELGGQSPTFLHTYPGGQPLAAPGLVPDNAMNNGIQYATPAWGGFNASVHVNAAETAGKTKGRAGWSANYTSGGFTIGAAGDSIDTQLQPGVTHQAAWMLAGTYDLQSVKFSAIHQVHKQDGLGNVYRIDTLGANVPVGQSKILFSWAKTRLDRQVGVDPVRDTYALTWDYFLSKRTDLYLHGLVDRLTGVEQGRTLLAGIRHRF